MTWKAVLPSIVAATAGFAVYFMVSGSFIGSMFTLPPYGGFKDIDLIYAVGLGLIGGVCGIFFIILYKKMRAVFEPMEHQPVISWPHRRSWIRAGRDALSPHPFYGQ